jgi:hypothetical protein
MNPPGQGWPPQPPENSSAPVPVDSFRPKEVHVKPDAGRWLGNRAVKHPRLFGLGCLAGSALLAGLNYAILESQREYYPQLLVLTPVIGTLGLWLVALGQPIDPATGKPRGWWRFGAGAACVIGVVIGIVLCVYVAA